MNGRERTKEGYETSGTTGTSGTLRLRDGPLKLELEDFYQAVIENRPVPHDGKWGKATLEICLAIIQLSRDGREVGLSYQVPSPY